MIKGLKNLSCDERLRKFELFSLEKRRLQGDLITAFQYLKGAYRRDGEGLFIREWSNRLRDASIAISATHTTYVGALSAVDEDVPYHLTWGSVIRITTALIFPGKALGPG
ncbi:hypothetical protein llap_7436 [Limosa lapponica baueri]|uniref:Uncharacterized protein n=1 Tax=Limosa lapponica baueri TaxID=1758121 RepID=A0A2I0U854_LIMLA|nr:hypothetical protein llap_7436 [Limosa lapponica baueri]